MARLRLNVIRRYLFWIVIVFVAAGLLVQIMVGQITLFSTSYYSPLYSTNLYSLSGEAKISQVFQARYPGLHRVDLFFKKRGDDDDAEIFFRLKDNCETEEVLITSVVDFSDLSRNGSYAFMFPAIDNSAKQKFCIVLETQNIDEPAELAIYASHSDVYRSGSAAYRPDRTERSQRSPQKNASQTKYSIWLPIVQKSETTTDFDVGFELFYNGPTGTTLKYLGSYITAGKPFLLGNPVFYVSLALFYGVVLIIFWRVLVHLKSGPKL